HGHPLCPVRDVLGAGCAACRPRHGFGASRRAFAGRNAPASSRGRISPRGSGGCRYPPMTVAIFVGSLLGTMALGIPIAFELLASAVALMWHLDLFDPQIMAENIINGANSFPLLAIPFFMLAGEIMNVGGMSRRIVDLAMALVGHLRGGLGYVTIIAACLMASLSGSAVADTAALTALLLPMLTGAGYRKDR